MKRAFGRQGTGDSGALRHDEDEDVGVVWCEDGVALEQLLILNRGSAGQER